MSTNDRSRVIRLPKSVLEAIDASGTKVSHSGPVRNKRRAHTSRKEARKQERLDRKKRRAVHFSTSKHDGDVDISDRPKMVGHIDEVEPPTSHATRTKRSPESRKPKPTALERLASRSTSRVVSRTRTREETEEDAYIAYLESKLGYSNGKTRRSEDEADGLGDLLDFADGLEDTLMNGPDRSDADSGLDVMENLEEVSDSPSEGGSIEPEESDGGQEWSGFDMSDDEVSQPEDIVEPESQPPERYVPPGLRKEAEQNEGVMKLTRQLKGLINRMSEQNMATVLDSIEEVYRNHRRNDVTSTLTALIIDGISSHATLLDSFVVVHAAFISCLHRLIGVEFAAYVIQNVVSTYERHLRDYETDDALASSEDRGKECSNLIVLLSELYNFQVISCILVYDIVRDLLGKTLSEFRVELLLKILRSSGQQLRQDDASSLKDIVTLAQSSIVSRGDSLSSRTKFMIETLTNLKNNKIKKAAAQHQGGDAVERMKKFLSSLGKKRHVKAHEALRVSLSDLRSAQTKGKWWLVGSAWAGDPLVDHQHDTPVKSVEVDVEDVGHTALLKLARKQGMNTDIRRGIFVVLMSSADYMDACERLAQLNLSEVQQREIVRVLLHCCGNEKSYNPYYALVCQQLCQLSHAYKITLQFCLWDFLRDLGETNVGGAEVIKNLKGDDGRIQLKNVSSSRLKNMAKAYGWWIAKDCCSLAILKPVDFTTVKVQTKKFLRELFVQVFAASQASSPVLADDVDEQTSRNRGAVEEIFLKAIKIEHLSLGLAFFISNVFREEEGFVQWASDVAKETLQRGTNEVPNL